MSDMNTLSIKKHKTGLMKIWGLLPIVVPLVLLLCLVWLIVGIQGKKAALKAEKEAQMNSEPVRVNVVALEMVPGAIRDRISLPAVVEPWVSLQVLVEVSGKIRGIEVDEGDAVKAGDVITVIDDRDYRIAYNTAKANYDVAVANLKRMEKLYKDNLTTRSNLDNASAQAESTKAAIDNASLSLERSTVVAPIHGIVNKVHVDAGQYLNHSDPVVEILQMDRVKIKVGIPESDVEAVRRLTDFKVTIEALSEKAFFAKKHFLSRTADARARLYDLSLSVENAQGKILPDMFARVEIIKNQVSEGLAVPLYAVITRSEKNIVYVVNDDLAHEREVTLGFQEGWRVQVTSGLQPGERVIVVGQRSVNDEQPVNLVQTVSDPEELTQ
ncbi:MAG: efflux RND transporter periplasmic adaptor subunit [Desulfobacteraceae bacterium]|nr:efflux RND transporter periplasmic adaptor subunit [Desulfobacteraceae bacterium]